MYYGRPRGAAIKFEGLRRTPKWWYSAFMRIFCMVSFWSLSREKSHSAPAYAAMRIYEVAAQRADGKTKNVGRCFLGDGSLG